MTLDSANQRAEYFGIFQPFESLDINCSSKYKSTENSLYGEDQSIGSPEKEKSLNLDEDVLYDQLPSPKLLKASLSFSGKKTKFIWTSGHFRILCDVLEFAWGIIDNWKRYVNVSKMLKLMITCECHQMKKGSSPIQ